MPVHALLTGHSRGLGAAIAHALRGRGIAVLGLSRGALDGAPGGLQQAAVDLGDAGALQRWLAEGELQRFFAPATSLLLINNAGTVQPIGALPDQDAAAVAQAVALNVGAALALSAAAASAAEGRPLRIAHVSSGAGRQAYAGWGVYCATKAALDHHARACALDGTPGLRVCSLAPGVVDTDMQATLRATPTSRFPQRERFVGLHREGGLARPQDTARRFVDHLLDDRFGAEPVADLRQL